MIASPPMLNGMPRRMLGQIAQWGYVVRDVNAGMEHWTRLLGIGPWVLIDDFSAYEFTHRGQRVDLDIVVALSYFGETQVELIQQRNDAPSPYKEFIDSGREGLQHFGFWPSDYEATKKALAEAGCKPVYIADPPAADIAATIYFESPAPFGPMIEISALNTTRAAANERMKREAYEWDGSDPVRRFKTLLGAYKE